MKLPAPITRRIRSVVRVEVASNPQVKKLRRRLRHTEHAMSRMDEQIKALTTELADARRQGRRAAELADLVIELLSNEASRRDPEFVKILERHLSA